jgi:2-amino-4-hydroxy-6-hydroxymethyldihydropteridine diphosphokinase
VVRVAVALGSNVGDRESHLDHAVARLRAVLDNVRVSRFYETEPVGTPDPQALFLNLAVVGDTELSARALLSALLAIEQERGRERPYASAPRTLDLDLVLFGDSTIDEPHLIVPHPRFRKRRFVLEPLAEIAPDLTDPVTKKTMQELLKAL